MKKGKMSTGYDRFFKLANILGEKITAKIHQKLLYQAKLDRCVINILEDDEINGFCWPESEKDIKIIIYLNKNYSEEIIAFAIGHELVHLLFARFDMLGDFCESDGSYALSTVTRKTSKGIYGKGLEELLADFISISVVCEMYNKNFDDFSQELENNLPEGRFSTKNLNILKRIIEMFEGEENETSKKSTHFDSIIVNENMMSKKNLLLYEACSGHNLSSVITDYDNYMGHNSWQRLNSYLDSIVFKQESTDYSLEKLQREIDLFFSRDEE